MDITSYLLGKNSSGGTTPTYQEKSVTITENGTTSVTADSGYDALNKVNITTNVSGGGSDLDWSAIGYSGTPQSIVDGYNYAVQIKNNWDVTQTDLSNKFANDTKLSIMPLVDTSNTKNMYLMFKNCSCLTDVALFDTSNVTNFSNMFDGCKILKTIPKFDTSSALNMKSMFTGCTYLENVPVLDTSSLVGSNMLQNAFSSCNSLTNTSLDNILQMCINTSSSYTGTKTLARLGFNSTYQPATTIQGLPHYQDFVGAGWTIGY